jgi:hypothetical protein
MKALLKELIETLQAQTKAINNLAESNCLLVQAMINEEDEDREPTTYLDGSPIG